LLSAYEELFDSCGRRAGKDIFGQFKHSVVPNRQGA